MIQLVRVRTTTAITGGLRGTFRVKKNKLLVDGQRAGDIAAKGTKFFNSDYWKKAKVQLKKESAGKCAYCEAQTAVVAHGDVEHYRPKTVYWWLAYCYDNYLYSCQICNEIYKSDKFPIAAKKLAEPDVAPADTDDKAKALAKAMTPDPFDDAAGLPLADFHKAATKEKAHLPDPYSVDPEPLFKWVADDVLKEVEVRRRTNRVASKRAEQAAKEVLGLNREELLIERYKTYAELDVWRRALVALEAAGVPEAVLAREAIADKMRADRPYSAMARYFVNVVWGLGLAVPA